jgi:hypothetical protein
MQYKTMVLELIQQYPQVHDELHRQKKMLATLEQYASWLSARHAAWKSLLWQTRPDSQESQIATEALELALKDLEDTLSSASPPDKDSPLSLEDAMEFLRRHSPPA